MTTILGWLFLIFYCAIFAGAITLFVFERKK
jgi:hypothetical protein